MGLYFRLTLSVVLLLLAPLAQAFTANINPGTRSAYLRVGDGSYSGGFFNAGGTMGNNATINRVSVTVPAAQVGSGTPLAMTTNATQSVSHYDGYTFCNLPAQVYVAAFYRRQNSGSTTGSLTVSTPTVLTNADGDTIPITEISWTTSGNGDTGGQPFPAGTFTGGSQSLIASFTSNVWRESCHTFYYANDELRAAGTYTARATYTLAIP